MSSCNKVQAHAQECTDAFGQSKETNAVAETYRYRARASWTLGRTGTAKSDASATAIHFAAPPKFGGLAGRWTSEALLLSALASCFTTTFHAIAGCSKFDYADLEVEAEGVVSNPDAGYRFTEVVVRPRLTILKEEKRRRAQDLLGKANALCLVRRALGIRQRFEPQVEVVKALPIA